MEVVGEARSGEEALELASKLCPDVVLMDLAMPGMGGLEAIRQLKRELPQTAIVALTIQDNEQYFFPTLEAGASGYLLKEASPEELLVGVRGAHRGEACLSPAVARVVLTGYMNGMKREGQDSYARLTPRERVVLRLATDGKTNQEMAQSLYLSVRTVEKHRASLMEKLKLRNRTDLIRYALERGLVGRHS